MEQNQPNLETSEYQNNENVSSENDNTTNINQSKEEYKSSPRPKGYAPIKPEYLKKEKKDSETKSQNNDENNDENNQETEEKRKSDTLEAEGAPAKKKKRGMNKNRNNHKQALHAKGGDAPKQTGQSNFLPREIKGLLKKKKYPYKRAEEKAQKARDFVDQLRKENEQHPLANKTTNENNNNNNDNNKKIEDNNNNNNNNDGKNKNNENTKSIEPQANIINDDDNNNNNNNENNNKNKNENNNEDKDNNDKNNNHDENQSETIGKIPPEEKRKIDFTDQLILAPLTTVGNLPFRRVCKEFGADITVGEMAVGTNIIKGSPPEWALLRRHKSEDVFGVQVALPNVDFATKTCELIDDYCDVDFVDLNCGCPIDLICRKGMGTELPERRRRFETVVRGMVETLSCPATVKLRTGKTIKKPTIHNVFPRIQQLGASAVTLHGRSRQQRYTKEADWNYITQCARLVNIPVIGNGDIFSHLDVAQHRQEGIDSFMIGRGALIKPWLFQEIKEERYWDIRSTERLDILQKFAEYGLDHWGGDERGVMHTRRFLLEWLSFLHRYIPVGLLEVLPQRLNERPPPYYGRDELETMMASPNVKDWIKLTEMVLGPVPDDFNFVPKHKSNSYETQG